MRPIETENKKGHKRDGYKDKEAGWGELCVKLRFK